MTAVRPGSRGDVSAGTRSGGAERHHRYAAPGAQRQPPPARAPGPQAHATWWWPAGRVASGPAPGGPEAPAGRGRRGGRARRPGASAFSPRTAGRASPEEPPVPPMDWEGAGEASGWVAVPEQEVRNQGQTRTNSTSVLAGCVLTRAHTYPPRARPARLLPALAQPAAGPIHSNTYSMGVTMKNKSGDFFALKLAPPVGEGFLGCNTQAPQRRSPFAAVLGCPQP